MSTQAVTFTWRETDPEHPAQDVLVRLLGLADNAYDDGDLGPLLLEKNGEGLWSKEIRLPVDLRSSYQFCVARDRSLRGPLPGDEEWRAILETGMLDPGNPSTIGPSTFPIYAPASVLELPGAIPQRWWAPRAGVPTGEVSRHELGSSTFWIYRPAGLDDSAPIVVVFDGKVWMGIDVVATFDNLVADAAIPPPVVVLVDAVRGTHRRVGLTRPELFLPFVLEELLPFVRTVVPFTDDPARSAIAGQSLGGLAAAHIGLHASDRFGLVLSQSGAFWWPGDSEGEVTGAGLFAAYEQNTTAPIRFFLEAGSLERGLLASNRRFREILEAQGYDLRYREYTGGHDYACWRGGLADGLVHLLEH